MEFIDLIEKHKSNAANIAVIVISLIVANRIYGMQNANTAVINGKIKTESSRNAILADISRAEKQMGAIKKLVNKKDMNSIVGNLQTIARDNSITIVSLKPQSEKPLADYTRYPYNFSITGTYHKIGKFISKLESSPDIYMIENINFRTSTDTKDKDKKDLLQVDVSISTLKIKD
ncbi:MAG: type 4a pilus biogenesis protein PilO [Candidatus Omnitrophota bacterium]|jgi:Tfp pilus assembly protein PilO